MKKNSNLVDLDVHKNQSEQLQEPIQKADLNVRRFSN